VVGKVDLGDAVDCDVVRKVEGEDVVIEDLGTRWAAKWPENSKAQTTCAWMSRCRDEDLGEIVGCDVVGKVVGADVGTVGCDVVEKVVGADVGAYTWSREIIGTVVGRRCRKVVRADVGDIVGCDVGRGVARKVVGADVGDTVGCDEVQKVVGADVGATQWAET
jgi:hypothetical protein